MTPKEIGQKWVEKTGNKFFNEFVEMFPDKKEFDDWLWEKELSEEEDEDGDMEWYPEGESYEIEQEFGFDIDQNEENCVNYCDFFNELCENNW